MPRLRVHPRHWLDLVHPIIGKPVWTKIAIDRRRSEIPARRIRLPGQHTPSREPASLQHAGIGEQPWRRRAESKNLLTRPQSPRRHCLRLLFRPQPRSTCVAFQAILGNIAGIITANIGGLPCRRGIEQRRPIRQTRGRGRGGRDTGRCSTGRCAVRCGFRLGSRRGAPPGAR